MEFPLNPFFNALYPGVKAKGTLSAGQSIFPEVVDTDIELRLNSTSARSTRSSISRISGWKTYISSTDNTLPSFANVPSIVPYP